MELKDKVERSVGRETYGVSKLLALAVCAKVTPVSCTMSRKRSMSKQGVDYFTLHSILILLSIPMSKLCQT